jgi:hypothetical protein
VAAQKARYRKGRPAGAPCRDAYAGGCLRTRHLGTRTDKSDHSGVEIGSYRATIVEGILMKREIDVKAGIGDPPMDLRDRSGRHVSRVKKVGPLDRHPLRAGRDARFGLRVFHHYQE